MQQEAAVVTSGIAEAVGLLTAKAGFGPIILQKRVSKGRARVDATSPHADHGRRHHQLLAE